MCTGSCRCDSGFKNFTAVPIEEFLTRVVFGEPRQCDLQFDMVEYNSVQAGAIGPRADDESHGVVNRE